MNLYGFADGDPVNFSDPFGLCPVCVVPTAVGSLGAATGAGASALAGASAANNEALARAIDNGIDWLADKLQVRFVTYTRTGPGGQVYSGRTSGVGNPQTIVNARARQHPARLAAFGPPVVDVWAAGPQGYAAIRGREQQLIDANGGAQSEGGTSANIVRAVNKAISPLFEAAATAMFGPPPTPRP